METLVLLLMFCTLPGYSSIPQPRAQRNHRSLDTNPVRRPGNLTVEETEDARGRGKRFETFSQSAILREGRDLVRNPPRTPTTRSDDGKRWDTVNSRRQEDELRQEERESELVAGISLYETRGDAGKGEGIKHARHDEWMDLTRAPLSRTSSARAGTETKMAATVQIITRSQNPPTLPPPHHVPPHVLVTEIDQRTWFEPDRKEPNATHEAQDTNTVAQAGSEFAASVDAATPKPNAAQFIFKESSSEGPNPTPKSNGNTPTAAEPVRFTQKPNTTRPIDRPQSNKPVENDTRASPPPPRPRTPKPSERPRPTEAKTPSTGPTKINRGSKKSKEKTRRKASETQRKEKVTTPTYFPYFTDDYCPPECACYGRVVQCSDKGVENIPYGIPYNSRYILLMNNHIDSIQPDLLRQYVSVEFLVLSNNLLTDGAIEGAFEGVAALKRLYLERNLLEGVPTDLPASLEELRLDDNHLTVMSEAAWAQCPGLLVLSLGDNILGKDSESLPDAVLSPLRHLRTLNLNHNQMTEVPLGLPPSVKELHLKGNHIEEVRGGAFDGASELLVLDLSANRLTNKGLVGDSLLNAPRLESLNLEGNKLKQVPQHLPSSLKTLNLKGNLLTSIKKAAFSNMKNLEHLGLARNKISRVALGAFRTLPILHQLDLGHNALLHVPRQLPQALHSVALAHNKIQSVPRDAFCWGDKSSGPSRLVHVQLQHNFIDMGKLDAQAFRCLRGFQVVHFS